ncbi:MAG: ADP-forming succinate--CoA ligase subunit beta [Bdellovibrionaceae bacterium]|nr:ADP-forming succinate--CoA ligase subunit beta [Pseudobdellovibrionaceae bacterium]
MNIHEYQAKEILKKYGVSTLRGRLAKTPDEAVSAAKEIGGHVWVVKAQIHAGGRGKGGGVKVAKSLDSVHEYASKMLGMTLVTHQTGPEGRIVRKLLIEEGCNIAKEYYVACLVDRATGRVAMMASSEGGMDIEEVAAHNPDAIKKVDIDPAVGLAPFQARKLAYAIGMAPDLVNKATKFFQGLYRAFVESDCSIAEINPLVVTKEGELFALDAKMNFDSNALFRHPEIVELRDLDEEDPTEIEASKYDLAFIKLDGTIGCLVNGAGLAMATLDIIKLHGASPANFLDVGGGASKEKVTAAFKIILKDPNVRAILVNIFGGIMKCDVIAEGVIAASREVGLKVPLVVRLEGTNVELGKKLLQESGLNIIPADGLTDAAKKVVAAAKG